MSEASTEHYHEPQNGIAEAMSYPECDDYTRHEHVVDGDPVDLSEEGEA